MDLFRIGAASLLGLSMSFTIGCANQQSLFDTGTSKRQVKPHEEQRGEGKPLPPVKLQDGDVLVKITEKGKVVPITESGKPYQTCVEKGKKGLVCRIFEGGITVTEIENITINRLRYTGSGECEMFSVFSEEEKKMFYAFNHYDADCREHHDM